MLNRAILLIFPILYFSCAIFAHEQEKVIFNHLGQKELANVWIEEIVQDDLGFFWMATSEGLCKYDGNSFRFIRHSPDDTATIENNNVTDIKKDSDGKIWFCVDGAGLYQLDPYTEKLSFYKNNYKPLATNRGKCLVLSGNDIFCGNYGGGLTVFHKNTKTFSSYLHDDKDSNSIASRTVHCLTADKNGEIWMGLGANGVDKFDPATNKITHYNIFRNLPGEHNVWSIFYYNNDDFLLATSDGLIQLWPETGKFIKYSHDEKDSTSIGEGGVTLVSALTNGQIIIALNNELDISNEGLSNFTHYKNDPADPFSIRPGQWRNFVYEDKTGTVWIGSQNEGLELIYPKAISPKVWRHDPQNDNSIIAGNVYVINSINDQIWLGTYGQGASRFDPSNNTFTNFYSNDKDTSTLSCGLIYNFFMDDSIYLWILTESGMNKVNLRTNKTELKLFTLNEIQIKGEAYARVNRTCAMWKDEKGNYWVGLIGGGLLYYETTTGKLTRYRHDEKDPSSLSDNRIMSMQYDKINNLLWCGTANGGLNAMNLVTHKFLHFVHDKKNIHSLTHDWDYVIIIDSTTNILWIGTDGGGLNALDLNSLPKDPEKAIFHHFTDADGLPVNTVYGIAPDGKGNVWLSSSNYICLFTPTAILKGSADSVLYPKGIFKAYYISNGLPFNGASAFTICFSKKDRRLYVGDQGFYSFCPDSIRENKIPPPIFITSFMVFGKPFVTDTSIIFKKTITLSYNQNFISFDFAVLNYIFPESNNVEWKLEGLEKDWHKSHTLRTANYTNLDPGTYVFHVRGANNDGYWNETGACITIIITPPFWKTNWFYALVIIFIVSSIVFYIKWRERKLKQDKKVLEATVEERTGELKVAYHQIEEKNKDITDSINYARRIQDAILPSDEEFVSLLPESFVLYKPKDIVSGDFYWLGKSSGKIIFAAVDCTGHGVPGAFMSLIGHNLLNEMVNEKGITKSSEILNGIREGVIRVLKQKGVQGENKDGMDISLCVLDYKTGILEFSGAYNPLWLVKENNSFEEIKADKQPIGITYNDPIPFTMHSVQLQKNDCIYIFTDGYADQFGGEKGKKFKYKKFQELLISISSKPMQEQKELLNKAIEDWKSGYEQNDDILVIGVKIT